MRDKIRQFMIGRYGTDGLNQFLFKTAMVSMLLSLFFRGPLFRWLMYGAIGWAVFRMLSRNVGKRSRENAIYYAMREQLGKDWQQKRLEWSQRDSYRYFRCPQCGQKLRVPKGRGRIEITCPKCHTDFVKKS